MKIINILIFFIAFDLTCYATVFVSNTNGTTGNWVNSSSWTYVSGAIDDVPDEDDVVTILNNHTISITSGYIVP